MASSKPSFPFPVPAPDPSDEVVREFGPLLRIYKSGRIERPLVAPPVDPGHDAATGVHAKAKLPVVVYVHGGGFVAESAASPSYHLFLNRLAAAVPALVVFVDYRLAPEHPLPAGYDDCLATLKWALSAADPWVAAHGDLARVFVAGDSAGGNICHHLTIHPDIVVGVQQESRPPPPPPPLIHEAVGEEPADPTVRSMGVGLWFLACPETSGMDDPRMNPMALAAPRLHTLACDRVMMGMDGQISRTVERSSLPTAEDLIPQMKLGKRCQQVFFETKTAPEI
ncbi:unnamed protein product [Miscanthus lutarioriparius]|uniref:Alpha/beta hydrolase fold-3 domain-containing protein n=1 Tax=Miscanthus lutarioriparius TaxID=422564 RepID=A0A811SSG0_9POAL|nr:unnamed protein product [Miscanthus lutarioriparius]